MPDWIKYVRQDPRKYEKNPVCAISRSYMIFNGRFVRDAKIKDCDTVSIIIDTSKRAVGFQFHNKPGLDTLMLSNAPAGAKAFSARGLYSQYAWIKTALERPKDQRRFELIKENIDGHDIWVIQIPGRTINAS